MNEDRKLTQAGADLIHHFEGCHQKKGDKYAAYKCPANVLTIGHGHTNHHGRQFHATTVWTREECDAAFMEDMGGFEQDVRSLVVVALQPWEFDALVSLTYNIGSGAFKKSTLLRKLNSGDREGAALEFHRWNKAGGKALAGLTRRRASEALMFQGLLDENYDGKPDPMPQAVDEPA